LGIIYEINENFRLRFGYLEGIPEKELSNFDFNLRFLTFAAFFGRREKFGSILALSFSINKTL